VKDEGALSRHDDRWLVDLSPGALGWLGDTSGTDAVGEHIAIVRFESVEAARANRRRPEQVAWRQELDDLYAGPVVSHDCPLVQVMLEGGSDDAGFVQVLQGRARDAARVQALNEEFSRRLPESRPGCIGATVAWAGDLFTDTVYFPDEEEARRGEAAIDQMVGNYRAMVDEWRSQVFDLRFFDLPDVRLRSP
jgi:hypothetical protein